MLKNSPQNWLVDFKSVSASDVVIHKVRKRLLEIEKFATGNTLLSIRLTPVNIRLSLRLIKQL